MKLKLLPIIALTALLPSCASVYSGTAQDIQVSTTPSSAKCDLLRKEKTDGDEVKIGTVNPTPGTVTVEKTKHNITVKCNKDGYSEGIGYLESGTEGATFGNIILGGGVGWAIDSARGADNKYPEAINVPLTKSASEE